MSTGGVPAPPPPAPGRAGRVVGVVVLLVVALVLALSAWWLRAEAASRSAAADRTETEAARLETEAERAAGDTGNLALVDAAATSAAVDYVRTAVEASFSYDHADLAATERAVDEHLTGDARCVYDTLFGEVVRYASAQKIVLVTKVRDIALTELDDRRAEALVYIDQSSTRQDVNKTVAVGGQLLVVAERRGDRWQIARLDLLNQPLVNGETAPSC